MEREIFPPKQRFSPLLQRKVLPLCGRLSAFKPPVAVDIDKARLTCSAALDSPQHFFWSILSLLALILLVACR